jgi:predicted nucleotidyltransferase
MPAQNHGGHVNKVHGACGVEKSQHSFLLTPVLMSMHFAPRSWATLNWEEAYTGKPVEVQLTTNRQQIHPFLSEFSRWAASQPDILAAALLGSYARNEATGASDVDLIILAKDPKTYLRDTWWVQAFGTISRQQFESYGKVTSLRVWYSGGHEVEYAFADETWSALPLDEATATVISDGMQILYEREPILSQLINPKRISESSK